jgi:subtilisin family serine protease
MKKLALWLAAASLVVACSKPNQADEPTVNNPDSPISQQKIDAFIQTTLQAQGKFEWSSADDEMIWSALQQSDFIASIGYKAPGMGEIKNILHTLDMNASEWKQAKQAILQIVLEEEGRTNKQLTPSNLEVWPEEFLPVVNVEIKNLSTVVRLRKNNLIRFVEPMGYTPADMANGRSSSGCGSNTPENGLVNGVDYNTDGYGAKISWNYSYHGVQNAWAKASGAGIKIFIIDTGCSFDQDNLGSAFNQGASSGRSVEKIVTLPRSTFLGIPTGPVETPNDGCGHGTSMAGACAAPRGVDGNAAGIAYNSNLVTCRGAEDVLLNASRENKGVANAYVNAANRADVRIISMSMGNIISSGQVADAIRYAYGKGKLMFCAAGTSFSWTSGWAGVIFPAWMSEVNAVTGVKSSSNDVQCDACHDGSETDFTVVMERVSDGRKPLSLPNANSNTPSTVGGSSVATASTAGMAAVVWSRFPSLNRDQILNKLIVNSSRYPNKSSNLGWGRINVDAATN